MWVALLTHGTYVTIAKVVIALAVAAAAGAGSITRCFGHC